MDSLICIIIPYKIGIESVSCLHSWVATIFQAVSTALVGETTKTCHDLVELVGGGKALCRLAIIQTNLTLSTMSRFSVLVATNVGRQMKICVFFI